MLHLVQIKSQVNHDPATLDHFYLSGWRVADDPEALAGTAVVGVGVGTGVEGCLGSDALDVVVGEVCCHAAVAGTAGDGGGAGELELLADHVSLLTEEQQS